MYEKPRILIVDDKPENLYALDKLLQALDVQVVQALSGAEALALTLEQDFCVAIVDIQMPEMDGYGLVELLRSNQDTATLPVIFVSAIYSDEYHHRKGYEAGAVDFMSKPFVPEILLSKIKVFIDLYLQRKALQEANLTLSKRNVQLETSHQVGQQVTSILDPNELLAQTVKSIQAEFGYYCVSVWLLNDEQPDKLILQASAKRDVAQPFEPGYAFAVNTAAGIIPKIAQTGQLYLANDVRTDSAYLPMKELPDTRSELALPLKSGLQVVGVLDIQSERPAHFEPADITTLQTLAHQIAIAIRNAQLYRRVTHFNEQLEQMVQQRTRELGQAYQTLEKMDQTKSDFIGIAAHELRTPLTVIKGYAQVLKEQLGTFANADTEYMLQCIVGGTDRLNEVINNMLDVAKIDAEMLKLSQVPTVLDEVVRGVQREFGPALIERRLTLTVESLDKLPQVNADPDLLHKVFHHLVLNAIKYTPDGGSISVSGETVGQAEGQPAAHVVVSDTGIGIDPANHQLIFEKFYQIGQVSLHSSGKTTFKGGGPGLGLAIARGIVLAHGGRIWAESPGYDEEKCPGSRFHVLLPASSRTAL